MASVMGPVRYKKTPSFDRSPKDGLFIGTNALLQRHNAALQESSILKLGKNIWQLKKQVHIATLISEKISCVYGFIGECCL